jgi:insertion element IS1 protein InsB
LGKKEDCWLLWAGDRAPKKICGWALGDCGTETARCLDAHLPQTGRLLYCTDFWPPYGVIFEKRNPWQGKAHAFTIERPNNRLRHSLARLRRKTQCYTKKLGNLTAGILLYLLFK